MAYENTEVSVSRSQEAIRKLILQNGGKGVAFVSEPPMEGFQAQVDIEGKMYSIRLQAECKPPVRQRRGYKSSTQLLEQECRRIWRVLYNHLKSIYEASSTGVLEFRRLILAYIVCKDGYTVGDRIIPKLDAAISGRPDRLLPAHKVTEEGALDATTE